jgi:hypothetical protein
MKPKSRFIASVINTAARSGTVMPWVRGPRRCDFIASRIAPATPATPARLAQAG